MTLINIGEMVKLLTLRIRQKYPNVQWRQIAGLRDVAAHGYQTLRMEDIWKMVMTDMPSFQNSLKLIINDAS